VLLFGSYARGDFNLRSDVDIIVVLEAFKDIGQVLRGVTLPASEELANIEAVCWAPSEARNMLKKPYCGGSSERLGHNCGPLRGVSGQAQLNEMWLYSR
jgi:hypothetical protein